MYSKLSYDQTEALESLVGSKEHYLILGAAGCGKTALRNEYMKVNPRVLLLGTTGASIAGTNDSFTVSRFIHLKRSKFQLPPTVIVEECSMMNATDFMQLNRKLKSYGSTQPFGGVQLILIGDLLQLPPVTGKYFFTSELYKTLSFNVKVLKENFRQQDAQLAAFCNSLRYGGVADTRMLLEYRRKPPLFTPTICATLKVANAHNRRALARWRGADLMVGSKAWKVDVPVVVTKNIYKGPSLVVANGTFGRIDAQGNFLEGNKPPIKIDPKYLSLNFAMTVHRAQGKTMSAVAIDGSGGMFSPHQLYVAVSRARFSERLYINNVLPDDGAVEWLDDLKDFARKYAL